MTQKDYSARLNRRLDEFENNEHESLEKNLSVNEVTGFVKLCQSEDRRGVPFQTVIPFDADPLISHYVGTNPKLC